MIMPTTIMYICFNREDDYYQTLFSILSLEKNTSYFSNPKHQIVIYTDNAAFFKKYLMSSRHNISYQELSVEQIYALKGGEKFQMVFRIKLALLWQALNQYGTHVLYLDADTFFMKDIFKEPPLSREFSGFHCDEGPIKGRKTKQSSWDIMSNNPQHFSNKDFVRMYNAGLIFVHFENAQLVKNAIDKLDELYPKTKFYFLEQLLISHELQSHTNIRTFEKEVNHYWYIKEFTKKIREFVSLLNPDSLQTGHIPMLPIDNVPTEKEFRSLYYQWPYKVRRKLFQWGLRSSINTF